MAREGFVLELDSSLQSASKIARRIKEFLVQAGVDEETRIAILVACDEAFANIHHHGYEDRPDGRVLIDVVKDGNLVSVTFTDFTGKTVPIEYRAKLGKAIFNRDSPGVGMHIMKELMDEIEYSRDGVMNRLVLRKKIPQG